MGEPSTVVTSGFVKPPRSNSWAEIFRTGVPDPESIMIITANYVFNLVCKFWDFLETGSEAYLSDFNFLRYRSWYIINSKVQITLTT